MPLAVVLPAAERRELARTSADCLDVGVSHPWVRLAARRGGSRSLFRLARELTQQPRLREFPIPHDGLGRDLQDLAGLLNG